MINNEETLKEKFNILLKELKEEPDLLQKEKIITEINNISVQRARLDERKSKVINCFLADILYNTHNDFHQKDYPVYSDNKETTLFSEVSTLSLDDHGQKKLLRNFSAEELKYFIVLLLNHTKDYFRRTDYEKIQLIAKDLLDKE